MELVITESESLSIDSFLSPVEDIIIKIILIGADGLEDIDVKNLEKFHKEINLMNMKNLEKKVIALLKLLKKKDKIWSNEEREDLTILTSVLHQSIYQIKSKFTKKKELSKDEKKNIAKPISQKIVKELELIPLEIETIGKSRSGSGQYSGAFYKIKGIDTETFEWTTIIDHSNIFASSVNSAWQSNLINDKVYLNKLLGNRLKIYNLVLESSKLYRKSLESMKQGDFTDLTQDEREKLLIEYNKKQDKTIYKIKTITKLEYSPKDSKPYRMHIKDEEGTKKEQVTFSKDIFYHMFFNKMKNIQLVEKGSYRILFQEGDAYLTNVNLSLPQTIWDWERIIKLWIKQKSEITFLLNLQTFQQLKDDLKKQIDEKATQIKISNKDVQDDPLSYFVQEKLSDYVNYPLISPIDWKKLAQPYNDLDHLKNMKNTDNFLPSIMIVKSKNKKLSYKCRDSKINLWLHEHLDNIITRKNLRNFSRFVSQRIRSNSNPKETVLLLALHLEVYGCLTNDVVNSLSYSPNYKKSRNLRDYMEINSKDRFWLSFIRLFSKVEIIANWDKAVNSWIKNKNEHLSLNLLSQSRLLSKDTRKVISSKTKATKLESCLDREDKLQKFIINKMSKIGVKFPWKINADWKSDIQSVKNVDKSNPSITDHYSGLLLYLTRDKKVLEEYEKQRKYCWGFALIKELMYDANVDRLNRLTSQLISSDPKSSTYLWALFKEHFNDIPKPLIQRIKSSRAVNDSRQLNAHIESGIEERFYYSCLALINEKELEPTINVH
ncbi:MAG: hypothetical protein ACTSVO_01755 [Candidatus Heimdallarchaeaceae archaeon]